MGGGKGGGGASASAVRAGAAFVEIFGKDKLSPLLDSLKNKFNAFGGFLAKAGGAGLAAGAAILTPITGLFAATVNRGKDLQVLADRFGTTTEAVSALAYAFETVNVPMEQFADTIKGLQQKLSQAADGQDDAFRRVGLSARELLDLPLEEQFGRIADALNRVPNPADRSRAAMDLLGEAGLKILPVLKNGSADLAVLAREAAEVGAVMSGDDARRATDVAKATAKAWTAMKFAALEVGAALLPQSENIKEATGWVTRMARGVREWIGDNKSLVLAVVGVGAALAAGGASLLAFGVAAKGVALALGVVLGVLGALKAGLLLLLSPVGLVVAGVGGLAYLFATQTRAGRDMVSQLEAGFVEFGETARTTWAGVVAAIQKGDFEQAFRVVGAGLQLEWAKVVLFWTEKWNGFKDTVLDGLRDVEAKMGKILGTGGPRDTALRAGAGLLSWKLAARMGLRFAGPIGVAASFLPWESMLGIEGEKRATPEERDQMKDQRRANADAARAAVAAAKANFAAEVNKAVGPAAGGQVSPSMKRLEDAARAANRVFDAVKGGFGIASARQQFGYGDKVAQRSLVASERTAKATEATKAAVEKLAGDVKQLFTIQ